MPDLEGKNRKKDTENRKFIKRFGRTKALSQCWTAVCDRHPGAGRMSEFKSKVEKRKETQDRKRVRAREHIVTENTS